MAKKIILDILKRVENVAKGLPLRPHAKDIEERIRRRTRVGQGLAETKRGAKQQKLKGLSDKYKQKRKQNKTKLSSNTKPGKSNLTLTGQLLDSISSRVNGNTMIIEMKEGRNDGAKNSDIIKGQSKQGRDFFELSDKELRGLQNDIKKDLIKRIKRIK